MEITHRWFFSPLAFKQLSWPINKEHSFCQYAFCVCRGLATFWSPLHCQVKMTQFRFFAHIWLQIG
uniref:Uncharacterized protein n=1 Tax=Anguilla anguilla TaxID=7936 RepID=A0A0E9PUC6_ANGAN